MRRIGSMWFEALLMMFLHTGAGAAPVGIDLPISLAGYDRYYEQVNPTNYCMSSGWAVVSNVETAVTALTTDYVFNAGSGTGICVHVEWNGTTEKYASLTVPGVNLSTNERLGVWIRFDGMARPIRLRLLDDQGEIFQYPMNSLEAGEWNFYVNAEKPHANWGSNTNGTVDYPVQLHSILIGQPHAGFEGESTVFLKDMYVLERTGVPATNAPVRFQLPEENLGQVYSPGDPVALEVQAISNSNLNVSWVVENFWSQEFRSGTAANLSTSCWTGLELANGSLDYGHYNARIAVSEGTDLVEMYDFRFAVMEDQETLPAGTEDLPFFGMCAHLNGPEEYFDLMTRYGVQLYRQGLKWSTTETAASDYSFPDNFQSMVNACVSNGIVMQGLISYGNELYTHSACSTGDTNYHNGCYPTSETQRTAYANYSEAVANHYSTNINYYEVWNEWGFGTGMKDSTGVLVCSSNTPGNYVNLLETAYAAIKGANSNITVIGMGGENPHVSLDSITNMISEGLLMHCDAISLHPYRQPLAPEYPYNTNGIGNLAEVITEVSDFMDGYDTNGTKKIWITESGWPSWEGLSGVSENDQARYLVRSYVMIKSIPRIATVCWYDFKNDGDSIWEDQEHNFGLVYVQRYNYAPKPSAVAYSVLTDLLSGAEFVKRQVSGDYSEIYQYHFDLEDGRRLIVAWTTGQECSAEIDCSGDVTVIDMMGRSTQHVSGNASFSISVSQNPIYVISELPTLHYTMDSVNDELINATDSAYNAEVVGDLAAVPGMLHSGIALDGITDRAKIPKIDLGTNFTVSCWVKLANDASGTNGIFGNSQLGVSSSGFKLFIDADDANNFFCMETANNNYGTHIQASALLERGRWHHVAAVIDRAAGTASLYVDGDFSGNGVVRKDFIKNSTFAIGAIYPATGEGSFRGALDDLKIYPGLLRSDQIDALSANVPMNHYEFEEVSNSVVSNETCSELNAVWAGADPDIDSGVIGNAACFSNTWGQYATNVMTTFAERFSIMFWARLSSSATGLKTVFANSEGGLTSDGVRIFLDADEGAVRIECGDGYNYGIGASQIGVLDDGWNHVALVFDCSMETNKVQIYINGLNETADGILDRGTLNDFKTAGPYSIGALETGGYRFHGWLDAFRIYNDLITEEYIQSRYLAEVPDE